MDKLHATEELILQSAMQVFIEKGRHGARMQEIADRAGINKALLHYYYRSKDNLYATVIEKSLGKNISDVMKILDKNLSVEEIIRSFIRDYIEILRNNPKLPLFILREIGEGGEIVSSVLNRLVQRKDIVPRKVLDTIQRAIDRGEIVPLDPRQLIITILGACLFFFIGEPLLKITLLKEGFTDRDRFIEERKEAIFNIIAYGIFPGGDRT